MVLDEMQLIFSRIIENSKEKKKTVFQSIKASFTLDIADSSRYGTMKLEILQFHEKNNKFDL